MVMPGGPNQREFDVGRKARSAGSFLRFYGRQKIGERIGQAGTLLSGAPLFITHEPDLPEDRFATYEGPWVVRDVNGRIFSRFTAEDKAREWARGKNITLRDGSKIFTKEQKATMAATPVAEQAASAANTAAASSGTESTPRPKTEAVAPTPANAQAEIHIDNADIYVTKPNLIDSRTRRLDGSPSRIERRRPSARRLLT